MTCGNSASNIMREGHVKSMRTSEKRYEEDDKNRKGEKIGRNRNNATYYIDSSNLIYYDITIKD